MAHGNGKPPRPPRFAVLLVSHPDGYIEAFAPGNIDLRLCRVPIAHTRHGEILAEEISRMTTPRRFAELWRDEYLRMNGTTRALPAEALQAAVHTCDALATLDTVKQRRAG